ncbi:MAG: ABC transporter substrate-binding protein [Dehalococcoidia bacterium]
MAGNRLPRRRFLGLGGALLVGACGGSQGKNTASRSTTGSATAAARAATAAAGKPLYGGTMVLAQSSDPGILNPGITTSTPTHTAIGPMFNGLIALDTKLQPISDLALKWTAAPDAMTYSFDLAPNVTWHDGKAFSSADVKFTFEQILLKFSSRTRSSLMDILSSIEIPSATSVVFKFKAPYSPFLSLIDKINAPILPQHLYDGQDPQNSSVNQHPVGTGAFKFSEGVKADHYTYLRNAQYFKPGQPYLDKIVVRIIPDNAARELAFEHGEADFFGPDTNNVDKLKQMSGVSVTSEGSEGFANILDLAFNLEKPLLQNLAVRQAIAYAIDKDFVVQSVYSGQGKAATGPVSSRLAWAYNSKVTIYPHDPAKANQLLDGAGYPKGGNGTRFKLVFPHEPAMASLAEVLRDQLKQAGIVLDIQQLERNAWIDRVYMKRDFDFSYTNFENGPDPDIGVKRMFISSNIGPVPFSNEAAYRNPQVDQLFSRAAQILDRGQRGQLYGQIQEIVTRDLPYISLVETPSSSAFRNDYKGLADHNAKSSIYYEDAWWTKGKPTPS